MKYIATLFAVAALVLVGCSGDDKAPADTGGKTVKDAGKTAGDAMKTAGDAAKDAADTATDAATKTMAFDCAKPGCTVTKEGTMANPPS